MTIQMAIQKLAEATKPVVNFKKEFLWLKQELRSARGLLQDADRQSRHSDDVKQWLENIRDVAMQAEDIFEECAVASTYGSNGFIFRFKMGRQIRAIKDRMRYITEKANQLRLHRQVLAADDHEAILPTTSQIVPVELRRSYLLPSDSHPVGIQSKVADILNLLNEPAISVIAVVGMGGIGKTYLLQHVYSKAKERYEKSIWLSVSQSYSVFMLQKDIVFQLKDRDLSDEIEKSSGISEQTLAQRINETLQGLRCLVVLDDVWRASREEDLLSRLGLPSGSNSQCKIVVTTRSKVVSTNLNARVYEMQLMTDEDSWRLFCVYAFGGFEEDVEPQQQQLKEAGRNIVKQCGNLPLAVKTIAASLANSKTLDKWELKLRQLKQVIVSVGHENEPIMAILKLSYDSLPARLKACFAYLSFFPEDEEIDPEYLIYLWIGEGFIPAGEDQWDVAWDCLHQLANLCLLQLWEDVSDYRLPKHCRIHDLLLDLAIQISIENKCAFSLEKARTSASDGSGSCCRILVAKKELDDNAVSDSRPVCLRTLSLSLNREIKSIPTNFLSGMSRLRVLDLSGTRISTLPASVGKLKLLKVLNLAGTLIKQVPECVRHLKSLLFLSLPRFWIDLPEWISELKCLQHLETEVDYKVMPPEGIVKLASLRTLRCQVRVSKQLEDLGKMTQLEELWLYISDRDELQRMKKWKLLNMRRLVLSSKLPFYGLLHVPENMRAMKHLESLQLRTLPVPSWICDFQNLRGLRLYMCQCSEYPELQRLSNLVSLNLENDSRCRELPKAFGKSRGFPNLRFLGISKFFQLEEFFDWEDGAMTCLEVLEISGCSKLKRVGEGLELLKTLKELTCKGGFRDCHWWEPLKEGMEYWSKIKTNNPKVNIQVKQV